MKQHLPSYLHEKKNVLYFGQKQELDSTMYIPPQQKQFIQIIHLEQQNAMDWLNKKAKDIAKSPGFFAILCTEDCARRNDYELLNGIRQHAILRTLPLLIYSKKDRITDGVELLRRGADDCINQRVTDLDSLKERLDFWLRYKNKIYNYKIDHSAPALPKPSFYKRMVDIIGASLILFLLSPLLLLIAIAIKLESKGSVLYTSKRVGTNYRIFEFIKFRSMYEDADQRLKELAHLNQYHDDQNGEDCFVKIVNDPRVTRVGRFIRKTSLDELPQLFNVLRGEMSLVGNRPLPLYEAEHLTRDDWAGRFLAPAGLTGLWQVTKRGKNDMSIQDRVQLDLNYTKLNSFWFDLGILLRTVPAMIQEENV